MFDQHRRWRKKFADAFRGLRRGMQGQDSFVAHIPIAILVLGLGLHLRFDPVRMCVLLLCVAGVISAELLNSSIEWLARAVRTEHDERIRNALDIAAGAVLLMGMVSALVGILLFGQAIFPDVFAWMGFSG